MKTLYALILAFLLPISAMAVNGSGNVSAVVGLGAFGTVNAPTVYVPLSNMAGATGTFATFSLYAGNQDANLSNANFYPFYKNGTQYQVPATCNGHACTAYCFNIRFIGGSANALFQLVSDTTTFAFNAAALTSGTFQMGATQRSAYQGSSSANTTVAQPGGYNFSASSFPGIQNNTATVAYGVSADCYEN